MSDLISRQVLELWNRYKPTIAVDAIEYDRELKKLLSTNLAEVGTDAISRQQAIDYFVTNVGFHDEDGYPIEDTDELRKIWTEYFSGIPSAEPKRGWWIEIINSRGVMVALRCSRCEKSPRHGVRSDFCPNCGADMREVTT